MIEITVKDSQTVIYVGGGNFMTQARPTNFHSFWTEKRLLPGESAGDFREVTAAERTALEKSDAAWVRPPQSFIDAWRQAVREFKAEGGYNDETGFFELNGLTDLTLEQARNIYGLRERSRVGTGSSAQWANELLCRTYFPIDRYFGNGSMGSAESAFQCWYYSGGNLEVVVFSGENYVHFAHSSYLNLFKGRKRLHTIRNFCHQYKAGVTTAFQECYALREITFTPQGLAGDQNFKDCPVLSLDSVRRAIEAQREKSGCTYTLHPNVYAALTEDILELAAQTGVTFAA